MKFQAPPVKGWVFTNTHSYQPNPLSADGRARVSIELLTRDKDFKALAAQCRDRWVISLAMGKETLHVALFDIDDIQRAQTVEAVALKGHENDVMLEMDANGDLTPLPYHRRADTLRARPFARGARTITADELTMLEINDFWHCAPLSTT